MTSAAAVTGPHAPPDWLEGGFGIYIHWPFCQAKCPYCDFNSHVQRSVDHAAWADALIAEMQHMRRLTGARPADTIFFGGGTPSLMAPSTVARLIEEADRLWGLSANAEITLEANPTSAEAENFRAYAAAGVNRLSLGVQALDDQDLKALGRQHTSAEALSAFDIGRDAFDRVSFDLIYARVGQTSAQWEAELKRALSVAVDHLSLYQLTIEPGTRFAELAARGRLKPPGPGPAADLYALTQDLTAAAGLPCYEISNHARPGAECRHNLIYWRYGDYAGIGPGAHGRITGPGGERLAVTAVADPSAWMRAVAATGHGVIEQEALSAEDQASEYLLMAMRLNEGASERRFRDLLGRALPASRAAAMEQDGLVMRYAGQISTTPKGRLLLNSVLAELLV